MDRLSKDPLDDSECEDLPSQDDESSQQHFLHSSLSERGAQAIDVARLASSNQSQGGPAPVEEAQVGSQKKVVGRGSGVSIADAVSQSSGKKRACSEH